MAALRDRAGAGRPEAAHVLSAAPGFLGMGMTTASPSCLSLDCGILQHTPLLMHTVTGNGMATGNWCLFDLPPKMQRGRSHVR